MEFLLFLEILGAVLFVAYLIDNYALKTVSLQVKILVYITWLLCFSIVYLLPYDIYHSLLQDSAMTIVWRSIYFAIFSLTWVFLPIVLEYQSAGEFSVKTKLKRAIVNNLIIYGIFALLAVLFLIYLWFTDQFNVEELSVILMAASNTFGMILVVIFMSYGIVAIPKKLWKEKNYQTNLKKLQFQLAKNSQKKQKMEQTLELKAKQLLWQAQKKGQNNEITQVLNLIPPHLLNRWKKYIPDLGEVDVVALHKQIKQLVLELNRLDSRQNYITIKAFQVEDILTNLHNPRKVIQSTLFKSSKHHFINVMGWYWSCQVIPKIRPVFSILLGLLTLLIVIAEVAVFIPQLRILNSFDHVTDIKSFLLMDMVLVALLSYISFSVFYALFNLKFANFYGLYWNKHTDAASLIFYAINCSRVSTPLGYNFLQIINDKTTAFSQVMGQANLVPILGNAFHYIFPILLITLILFNVFDIYHRIANQFGVKQFQFQPQFSHQNIEQGKNMLLQARSRAETKVLNNNGRDLREFNSYTSESDSETHLGTGTKNKENVQSDQIANEPAFYNNFANKQAVNMIFNM